MTTPSTILTLLTAGVLSAGAYELHEWGTFTTVSGSDGVLLTGLEREEEALPAYVRHHPGFMNHHPMSSGLQFQLKRMPVPARNVKVKMETPVIYFHSDEAFSAHVKVGFEGGTISQWYPERSGGEIVPLNLPVAAVGDEEATTTPNILDFAKPYTGSIEWKLDVLSPEESRDTIRFKPDDLLQWTRARVPEANMVRAEDGDTEGFLFYRGLGSFEPGLHTTVGADETLQIENRTGGDIPYLIVYEKFEDGTTRWREASGPLGDGESITFSESELKKGAPGFDEPLYRTLRDNLAAQGLLRSEADAMVQTWWQSYFARPGLRVFWVLPDSRTDAILPLSVTPAPAETVRVIVGRSEVIRPRQETEWVKLSELGSDEDKSRFYQLTHDRFGLAYQERIKALTSVSTTKEGPSAPSTTMVSSSSSSASN